MGRVWTDDNEPRQPISTWRIITVIVLLIIFILAFTSCATGPSSIPLPESAPAPAPQPLDMEGDRIVEPEVSPEFELCDEVVAGETSYLVPDDWADWCVGVVDAAEQFLANSDADNLATCDGFWMSDDADLVAWAIENGGTFSWGVGFVDFMWWFC